jgi:large subunit ribosomal protein L10
LKKIIVKKQSQVNELAEKFQMAKTIVAFDYHGLTVEKLTDLRSKLRENDCEVKVYKNNISRRAAEKVGFDGLQDGLVGAKAIALSYNDVVAPAKIINEFARANKNVKMQVGVIEGKVVGNKELIELATLPSRETLLTMLAVGMLAPVRDVAVGLNMLCESKE